MKRHDLLILNTIVILFYGLMSGFFYAFSVCVMPGLNQTEPEAAIQAMQGINSAVRNPVFFITYFLTPVVSVFTAFLLFLRNEKKAMLFMIAAAVIYAAGVLAPTFFINVPMNETLAAISKIQTGEEAIHIWQGYSAKWTLWNTLRSAFCLGGMLLSVCALYHLAVVARQEHIKATGCLTFFPNEK